MKAWPGFDANGDMPPGVHQATLAEVVAHFGSGTPQRQRVARRLEHIYALAKASGHLARFMVFGSFVTGKPAPNDVDLFLLMEDSVLSRCYEPERLTHQQWVFGSDVFCRVPQQNKGKRLSFPTVWRLPPQKCFMGLEQAMAWPLHSQW
jgi:hypothetical protein